MGKDWNFIIFAFPRMTLLRLHRIPGYCRRTFITERGFLFPQRNSPTLSGRKWMNSEDVCGIMNSADDPRKEGY